ncbi:aminoacyl-histidine dipeptidase [Spirochaeta lutea]|uniref:Cytosol non-specific dipeptidase n=1 Tax=Spirochaeta lutea TaxID=1480694 RepID=A0A098QUC1_9SPIO|nr:aminoacyl-histidine dipeptidase [Spirochaeta lutea]KGE71440.1 hypothetical protein DC28_11665 [Spirochaeta lutea]
MNTIVQQDPQQVWKQFEAISAIPRCSKCEDGIIAYLKKLAESRGLQSTTDGVGNLIVRLPGTPGYEDRPGTILQGHVDMVCEKNRETTFDFEREGIRLEVREDWLSAQGTTLGADNGIAVAYMTALMVGDYPHGPLELLFTVDEETGLTGAMGLDASLIQYRQLLNIDTEEEGHFCIGCAGGKETIGTRPFTREIGIPEGMQPVEISITGLRGGHSGADIHMELGNALVLMGRIMRDLSGWSGYRLVTVVGGDKHNAIPREAFLRCYIPSEMVSELSDCLITWKQTFLGELGTEDAGLAIEMHSLESENTPAMTPADQRAVELLLQSVPHGILGWSRTMPGMVSTSTNLAAVKIQGDAMEVLTSQRSDIQSLRDQAAFQVGSVFKACGFGVEYTREYPSWTPDPNSPLLKLAVESYKNATGNTPEVEAIHAGLECGVIGDKIPGIRMLSFGPDIRGAHTPQERVNIPSVARTWEFLLTLLTRL